MSEDIRIKIVAALDSAFEVFETALLELENQAVGHVLKCRTCQVEIITVKPETREQFGRLLEEHAGHDFDVSDFPINVSIPPQR